MSTSIKQKNALNVLSYAIEKDESDWIATTAYYARYFAFYAILQKCGIKSEIHDCTLSLMVILFVKHNIIDEKFYKELQLAKELRVDTQYYVTEDLDREKIRKNAETARDFVLKMEEVLEELHEDQVKAVREKVESGDKKNDKEKALTKKESNNSVP